MSLKILIVDDELIIRDGIGRKINRLIPEAQVVGMAQDAIEGLEVVKTAHPNVIITDIRMPEVDGLQFISNVRDIDSNIKFIVISGFQEFEYARSALRLGVEDYLLKPIDNNQLVQILKKIENHFQNQSQSEVLFDDLKNKAIKGITYLKNKYFTDLIEKNDTLDTTNIINNLEIIGVQFTNSKFCVVTIAITSFENMPLFTGKEDSALAKFAISNISEEILSPLGTVVSFEYLKDEKQLIFVINFENDSAHISKTAGCSFSDIDKLCEIVLNAVSKHLKIAITIGIGSPVNNINDIYSSYLQSYCSLTQRFVLGDNKVINIKDVYKTNKTVYFLPDESKILLINYIKDANSKRIIEIIEKVFQSIIKENISYSNVKILYIDLLMLFTKTVKEIGGSWDHIFTEDVFSDTYISRYTSIQELLNVIKEFVVIICSYISDLQRSHGRKVIEEIKDFINNYYYTNINLNDLASKYYLNSSYLSQLFKSETGETFVNYLTSVRMEKSKELLCTTDLKTYKISEMVGYNNPRYFSDVFQKYFNCTPKEFRDKHN